PPSFPTRRSSDLLATNSAARLEDSYPDAMLIFTYPFEFDPEVRAKISRHGDDLQEAVKEIHVGFGPVEDRRIGRRTRINVTMFHGFVLIYGRPETHERTRQR